MLLFKSLLFKFIVCGDGRLRIFIPVCGDRRLRLVIQRAFYIYESECSCMRCRFNFAYIPIMYDDNITLVLFNPEDLAYIKSW